MSKSTRWSPEDLKKKGLVENNGVYVPVKSLVATGKVEKIEPGVLIQKGGKMKAAIKTEIDGIVFDSRLEGHMYTLLRGSGLSFDRQVEYLLQPDFKYNGETIRSIKIVVDFYINGRHIIIDTKGFMFRDGSIKYKMLKWFFLQRGEVCPTIEMPKDKKECQLLLNRLLYDKP